MATAADIAAARRLIAQFEDRAIGRHNSSKFRPNIAEQELVPNEVPPARAQPALPVSEPAYIRFAHDYREAKVGECCMHIPHAHRYPVHATVRVMPPPKPFVWSYDVNPEAMVTIDIWEFERVLVQDQHGEVKAIWKRIA